MPSVRILVRSSVLVLTASMALGSTAHAAADCAFHALLRVGSTFPLQIKRSGCYRLAADVKVTDRAVTAVKITVDDVRLNLDGHRIVGPNTCSGKPTTCTLEGAGIGIDAVNTTNVVIRNGSVRGFGSHGIRLGRNSALIDIATSQNKLAGAIGGLLSHFEQLTSEDNEGPGAIGGDDSTADKVFFKGNGKRGCNFGKRAQLSKVRADENGAEGCVAEEDADVDTLSVSDNGLTGFKGGDRTTIHHGKAKGNHGNGLQGGSRSSFFDSSSLENFLNGYKAEQESSFDGVDASGNGENGFELAGDSNITRCIANKNEKSGVKAAGSGNRLSDCTINRNMVSGAEMECDTAFLNNNLTGNQLDRVKGFDAGGNVCSGADCPTPPACP